MRISYVFLIFICVFLLHCKKDNKNGTSTPTPSSQSSSASLDSKQCYSASATSLKLAAEEKYEVPSVGTMNVSSTFPNLLTFTNTELFDHGEISICKGKVCEQTYTMDNTKPLAITGLGIYTVKLRLCFNTTCGETKSFPVNVSNTLSENQKAIAKELHLIDERLLALAKARLAAENSAQLTPYVFLESFKELFINQPQKLELAESACSYSATVKPVPVTLPPELMDELMSAPPSVDVNVTHRTDVDTVTGYTQSLIPEASLPASDTGTVVATTTETTQSDPLAAQLATAQKFIGFATLAMSSIMFGINVVELYDLNKEMRKKRDMFMDIRELVQRETKNNNIKDGNLSDLRAGLENMRDTKYKKIFFKDSSEAFLNKVVEIDTDIKNLTAERDGGSASNQRKREINRELGTKKSEILKESLIHDRDPKAIQKEYRVPMRKVSWAIGKFIGFQVVTATLLAVGFTSYNLAENSSPTTRTVDAEIYGLIVGKLSLLSQI